MKKRLALLVLAVASLVLGAPTLATSAPGKHVPFKAVFTFTTSVPAHASPCAEIRIDVAGHGVATLLGRFTTVQYQCTTSADPLSFTGGKYTFTGAHGETIFGSYAGRFVPIGATGRFSIDATFTIDGGTGRFAGATGGGDVDGEATQASGTVILDGTISLARSPQL
jgi:hypothetical protein